MKGKKVKTGFLAGILVLLLVAVPAMGEQKEANLMNMSQTFNIEAGVLEDALDNYSEVTGIKTVYLNELVEGKKSPGVQGIYSPEAAVQKILKGTGLTYQVTAENTVVLKENKMVVAQKGSKATSKKEDAEEKEGVKRPIEIEEMTVTAQKQEENVQEVPISVSVFNELDIEDRKIESVRDIDDFVPNFTIYQYGYPGMNTPTMRGISASLQSLKVATGLYVDGVPILSPIGFEVEMLDIERIEVLRGPQGTIYGKGTEAGAISIITKQPGNEFRGKISVEGGGLLSAETGDKLKGAFSLNLSGPIQKDRLFFSIAGKYYQKDGFIENTMTGNTVDDREHWFGKAHLRWTPMDKLDISLIASRLEYDDGDFIMNLGEIGAAMFGLSVPQDRKVSSNLEGKNDSKGNLQSLKIAYDISESLIFTSVTTNWLYNDNNLADFDYSPATLMHSNKHNEYSKVSQELRLDYSADRLKWLVGLYYDKIHNDIDCEMTSDIPSMAGIFSQDADGDTYAVFANLTYPLTKRLSLVTGLRYENEEQDFENNISHFKTNDSWDAFTPKIALQYRFSPEIITYISASRGYRSGGFNWMAIDPQYYSYDQEELWSYEIGAKSAFLDNRLIINGSVYYMDITDMQVNEAISPIEIYVTNAAEATAKGVELEMTARVSDGLSFMAGFGYSDIEFDAFSDALGDYKGNKNPFAPEYTFNIGGQYRHPGGFYARADLFGYGKMYFDKANEYSRDAYELVNAKIGYEAKHFDVYLYAKNLFDKEYDSDGAYDGFFTIYSDPGEIGLQLVYRF